MSFFKRRIGCVYAGPEQMKGNKEAEMLDVYAGPDMMNRWDEKKDNINQTYPMQYEADSDIIRLEICPDCGNKDSTGRFCNVCGKLLEVKKQ